MKKQTHKHILLLIIFISIAGTISAQVQGEIKPVEKTFWMKLPEYFSDPLVIIGGLLFLVLAFVIYALAKSVSILSKKVSGEQLPETVELEAQTKKAGAWSKLMNIMTASVPVAKEADVMLDHNYDGIRELDNQLPPWWKWGFVFTIIFAVVYLIGFHVTGTGKLSLQEYADEMKQAEIQKEERIKLAGEILTPENVVAVVTEAELTEGKSIFIKNCVACHGDKGQGIVGPNLTDEFWLHGGGIKNVFRTITDGVPNKGMISWKAQLAPKQIQQVASFILTLKGTKPAGAKEPQGDLWVEEQKPDSAAMAKKDSATVLTAVKL